MALFGAAMAILSMSPYSTASSGLIKKSLSESSMIFSIGWPVSSERIWAHISLSSPISLAWMRDIGGGAADAAGGLVDHDPAIGEGEALAFGAGCEEQGSHGGGLAEAVGIDVVSHEAHRVVDRKACGDIAARGVDVDVDIFFGIFGAQEEELGDDRIGDLVIDLGADKDDPVF